MTRLTCLTTFLFFAAAANAQQKDTVEKRTDTISAKRWVIVVEKGVKKRNENRDSLTIITHKKGKVRKEYSLIGGIDLGWSNYTDNTNYTQAFLSGDVAQGIQSDDLNLNLRKSMNVNLWFVMDEVSLIKKAVMLQYGFGLELNNYSFESRNTYFSKNPTYVSKGTEDYKKAKLAADYLSVPLMLKFNLTPSRKTNPLTIAGGISGGFLYSARFKTKNNGDVTKLRNDFDLNRFKVSYVGELGLGPIKLYGSYATRDMFRNELNMTPYTIGFRFVD